MLENFFSNTLLHPQCRQFLLVFVLLIVPNTGSPEQNLKQRIEDGIQTGHQLSQIKLSSSEKNWLAKHPIIRLGSESNWLPIEFIDQSGKMQGFSADLIKILEQRLGIRFHLYPQINWSETFNRLNNHELDIVASIVKTKRREKHLSFSQAYLTPSIVIYTRKDSPEIGGLDALNGKTVSVENNYYILERLKNSYPDIRLHLVDTTSQALIALSHGEVDAYIGIQGPANAIIEQNALTNLKIAQDAGLGKAHLRFAVRNDWPVFLGILNKTLSSISHPEMLTLRRKWLGVSQFKSKFQLSPEQQHWLNKHKVIRFSGDPNWLPYEAFDANGNYIGIVAEYLKLIEQYLGIKFNKIATKSWVETVAKVKQGEIDILSETIDSSLSEQLRFSQVYLTSPIVIIMKDNEAYIENIDEIIQKKIALINDYGYVPTILTKYPQINYQFTQNIQEGLTQVSTGEVDALLATLAQSSYYIAEMGINNIHIVGKTEFNTRLGFGVRKDFEPFVEMINLVLNDITPAQKKSILEMWGSPHFATKPDYALVAKIAGALVFLNAMFYYWNRKLKIEVKKREASEQEVRLLNQRFALATKMVSLGVWQWDLDTTNSFVFDERMFAMYGIPKQSTIAYADWINTVHPDDHQLIEETLELLKKSGGHQHLEFRIIRSDGAIRHIYSGATIIKDKRNGETKLYGVNWDITERKQAEAQFRLIIETLPLAIVITNNHGEILLENPQAIKELGNNSSLLGRNASEFYENSKQNREVLKDLIKQRRMNGRQVKYKISADKTIDCLLSVLPIQYENQDVWLVVIINLSERIKIEKHLADAREQAEKASKAKSEFLANMSHEIRTPMNAIIGFTELLNEQIKDRTHNAYVKTIQSAGNTLLTLINDILDLSKIEAGKLSIEKTTTNPHRLLTEITNIFMLNAGKKGIELILDIDPKIPDKLLLDSIRLRQVLLNLVGNAIKFTEVGYVKLIARVTDEGCDNSHVDLLVDIEDTGAGISEDQLEDIFTEFTQSTHHDQLKYGGTGLGLSISRRLSELMGGEISVKSQPGIGSTFTVRLNNVGVVNTDSKSLVEQREFNEHTIYFDPAVVMIVDDIESNRNLIQEMLAPTALSTIEAKNGLDAIKKARDQAIDLILMDLRMPDIDGRQTTEQIKSFINIPIIVLTASVINSDSDVFDGYLQKPISRSDLLYEISQFLKHQIIIKEDHAAAKLELGKHQYEMVPEVLNKLSQLSGTLQKIQDKNNLSEIKAFAQNVKKIGENYHFKPVIEYADQLNDRIEVFDIQGMKQRLVYFSNLQIELSALTICAKTDGQEKISNIDQ